MYCRVLVCLLVVLPIQVAVAQDIEVSPTLASNLRSLAAYRIWHGRIAVDTGHFAGGLTMNGPRPSMKERLVMHALDGDALIHYTQSSRREEISLQLQRHKLTNSWDVELLRRPHANSRTPAIWLVQRSGQKLVLRSEEIQCEHESFWNLWLAEPELCREQLWPLLKVLRPEWPLGDESQEIARLSAAIDRANGPQQRAVWQELVEELGSDRALERDHAFRSLLADRPAVLVFLQRLPLENLDAEQRLRVRKLLAVARPEYEDTPVSAAVELAK